MTPLEIQKAFDHWKFHNMDGRLNQDVREFLSNDVKTFGSGEPWIRRCRTSLQISGTQLAGNLGISRTSYSKIEQSENDGTISLKMLAKVAEAMDCELVYAIRPKQRVPFSLVVWKQILPKALKHPWIQKCDRNRKAEALAAIARRLMRNSQFRREQGWSQRFRDCAPSKS